MSILSYVSKEDKRWVIETQEKIRGKMGYVCERSKYKIPYKTINGVHTNKLEESPENADGINWWTNGFWPGILWLLYNDTKEEKYKDIANYAEEKFDQCFDMFYGLHHDVGFMWIPSSVTNYKTTGNSQSRKRALHAANLLAGRFNLNGRFIRAWNDPIGNHEDRRGWAIIDCMLNIPLLYWASEETNDPRYRHIAEAHADTVMANFIREDGSVEHIVEFDPESGKKVAIHGGQGYEDGSSWTRGQAWGIYGFVMSNKHTSKRAYLEAAKKIADYFISQTPESYIIPVDFKQPSLPDFEDSTAAAIAACGLIELSRLVDKDEGQGYMDAALSLLKVLADKRAIWNVADDGILTHCKASYHDKEGHINMIYADYFFIEGIYKLAESDFYIW